jgi:hypothetical protein
VGEAVISIRQTRTSARQNAPPATLMTVWARADFVPFQPSLNVISLAHST